MLQEDVESMQGFVKDPQHPVYRTLLADGSGLYQLASSPGRDVVLLVKGIWLNSGGIYVCIFDRALVDQQTDQELLTIYRDRLKDGRW